MSRKYYEKIDTQHVSFRQRVEEKVRGKGREEMGRRERMKRGSGMKNREERSRGMETLITQVCLAKIKPTEPLKISQAGSVTKEKMIRLLR